MCTTVDSPGSIELTRQFDGHPTLKGIAREARFDKKTNKWQFEFVVEFKNKGRR